MLINWQGIDNNGKLIDDVKIVVLKQHNSFEVLG